MTNPAFAATFLPKVPTLMAPVASGSRSLLFYWPTIPACPWLSRVHSMPVRLIGLWLSLVERLVRDEEAAGSNPVSPTTFTTPYWEFFGAVPAAGLNSGNGASTGSSAFFSLSFIAANTAAFCGTDATFSVSFPSCENFRKSNN